MSLAAQISGAALLAAPMSKGSPILIAVAMPKSSPLCGGKIEPRSRHIAAQ